MTPEEQAEFVALQDKLAAAEKERDEHAATIAAKDKDIDDLKKINQQLFLRATTPAAPPMGGDDSEEEEETFSTEDILKEIKGANK